MPRAVLLVVLEADWPGGERGQKLFCPRRKDTRDLSFRELLILPQRTVFNPLYFFVTCIHNMDGMDTIYWLRFDVTLHLKALYCFYFCSCREIVTFLKVFKHLFFLFLLCLTSIVFCGFYIFFYFYFLLNKISQRCESWCAIDWPICCK